MACMPPDRYQRSFWMVTLVGEDLGEDLGRDGGIVCRRMWNVDGIGGGDGSWMEIAQDRQRWRGLVGAVMGYRARQPVE